MKLNQQEEVALYYNIKSHFNAYYTIYFAKNCPTQGQFFYPYNSSTLVE